ncbi:hypothetical protein L1987_73242 [Smallanthus sonchifolius]|uniref:Uncharacterized protein n=1 Tax=Smallanthus sonchifolius TaxID=185202 RepID=A0ACB9A160_9ASTR|nr:hypothetical protein L1987_73242 [Smallanthus sonchifolius]
MRRVRAMEWRSKYNLLMIKTLHTTTPCTSNLLTFSLFSSLLCFLYLSPFASFFLRPKISFQHRHSTTYSLCFQANWGSV